MLTKYYIDGSGNYLGGFENAPPPAGAVEVPDAPENAADVWTGFAWDTSGRPAPEPEPLDAEELYDILETKGVLAAKDRPRPKPARP